MNIRDMEYIVAVAHCRHFSKAADKCNVSQPTLSSQIKKLEDYLGVSLFHRSKKNGDIIPTATGEKIIRHAEMLLKQKDIIRKIAKQAQNPLMGDIRIGAFPTLAPYYFPPILPLLKQKLPDLKFYIIEDKTARLQEMLYKDMLDIAFLALPLDDKNLKTIPLFFDPFYAVMHHEHPLAQKQSLCPQDILNETLLLLEDGHCLQTQALDFCQMIGHQDIDDFRASSPEMLLEMVRMNTGISLMPHIAMNIPRKDLKFVPFQDKTLGRNIGMVYHPEHLSGDIVTIIQNILLNMD